MSLPQRDRGGDIGGDTTTFPLCLADNVSTFCDESCKLVDPNDLFSDSIKERINQSLSLSSPSSHKSLRLTPSRGIFRDRFD